MLYAQLVPFNTSQGGNVPNLCLDNVRRGYGISNKYGSAWEAWQHTQQHPDRNVPTGLAVPLYYSYTTTLDGMTQNYGHINVQLPDGRVWSDGNFYASLEAYLANHAPRFVGWGESVNDFKIIEEGEVMLDAAHQATLFVAYLGRLPYPEEVSRDVGKKTTDQMINELDSSSEYTDKKRRDADAYAALTGFEQIPGPVYKPRS